MRVHPLLVAAAMGLLGALALSGVVHAQTARSGGGASAQLLLQLQQLASERTSLQADNTRLKKELDEVRKERDQLKKGQKGIEEHAKVDAAALAHSVEQRQAAEQEVKRANEKLQELIAKFKETIASLQSIEAERANVKQTLAARDQELKICLDRNHALYQLDDEVLTRWEKESLWSKLAQAEPFTKIKRVQLENLADDYRARAEDQRATPESLKAATRAAPPPPAPATATKPGSANTASSASSSAVQQPQTGTQPRAH